MKINIVSDIHAIVKNNKVCYSLPLQYKFEQYKRIFNVFYAYYKTHRDEVLSLAKAIDDKYKLPINNYDNIDSIIEKIKCFHDSNYILDTDLSESEFFKFSRFCNYISLRGYNPYEKRRLIENPNLNYLLFLQKQVYEFKPEKLEPADYLIIAGDIGLDDTYERILQDIKEKTLGKYKDVFFIKGNHDYWNVKKAIENARNKNANHIINIEKDDMLVKVIDDYVFLGCTMWTPIDDWYKPLIADSMNDYRYIPSFTVDYADKLFYKYKNWLEANIEKYKDKKIIVFTHHCPFIEMLEGCKQSRNNIRYAYAVAGEKLANINKYNNIVLWACGHAHRPYDKIINGIRCVRNPIGYSNIYGYNAAENYNSNWYNTIIEV